MFSRWLLVAGYGHWPIRKAKSSLVEKLIGKVEQDDSIFHKLVKSERFQRELQEDVALLKKDPSQFTDLYKAYQKQKAQ